MPSAFGIAQTAAHLAALARVMPASTLRRPPADFLMRDAPSPADILRDIPLPPKIRSALERAVLRDTMDGQWTVGRLLSIQGFGLRSLHDAVATAEALRQARGTPDGSPAVLEEELAPFLVARPRIWPRPPTPLLEQTIGLIGTLAPASEKAILTELLRTGLSRGTVTLGQIERASRFVEVPIPYAILRRGDLCLVVQGPDLSTAQRLYGLAVRSVVSWGLANIVHLAEQAKAPRIEFLRTVVSARTSFRWLDAEAMWFWFESEHLRLARAIAKALSLGALSLPHLAAIVFEGRPLEFTPPLPVLGELCRQLPSIVLDDQETLNTRTAYLKVPSRQTPTGE